MMRRDFFEIVEHARRLSFCVKLKTNAVMIREREADRLQALALDSVQISIYSHRAEVHDAITKLPGSLKRTIAAVRLLVERGVKVIFANVLMRENFQDYPGVQALAAEVGAEFTIDPTITPMMDGDRSILNLNIERAQLQQVFRDASILGTARRSSASRPAGRPRPTTPRRCCHAAPATPSATSRLTAMSIPACSSRCPPATCAPAVPRHLEALAADEGGALDHPGDLPVCSTCAHGGGSCTRCPGLAYMEGNMRGPSSQDCEKSFARTGVETAGMLLRREARSIDGLVQIRSAAGPDSKAESLQNCL